MKQRYESPRLVVYGRIADNTFQTLTQDFTIT